MLIKTTLGNSKLLTNASIVAVGSKAVLASVKTAAAPVYPKSKYHGEIAIGADGTVDLAAEMGKHPDFLWIKVKAIESDIENDNGDFFPKDEIVKAYKSFEGVPVFTNHENTDVEKAKGKVVKAEYDEATGDVYCTMYIDRKAYPHLARAVEEGYVTDVSMGTQVEYSTCSICTNKAATAENYCDHVRLLKGRSVNGKKVFEKNYGLKFIEISVVTDGACKDCTIREVIDPSEFVAQAQGLSRAANAITRKLTTGSKIEDIKGQETVEEAAATSTVAISAAKDAFKVAVGEFTKKATLRKDGGQAEIGKLNQAMDLLEDVTRAMLDQRQFIDLEFMQKVAEVLAELQHVTDELVDQGYGSVGQQAQQAPGLPPLPGMPGMEQELPAGAENPMAQAPGAEMTPAGVGKVTEPVAAKAGPAFLHRTASQLKDLLESVKKSLGERKATASSNSKISGGMEKVSNKYEDTIRKLAGIWDTPSVKNYITEVGNGEMTVTIGTDEVIGSLNGEKVATLKVASLGNDIRLALEENPAVMGHELLKALEVKMNKQAEKAPVDGKEQVQQTMESQLRDQKLPTHPRQNDPRESITEKQLSEKFEGYDYNARTDDPKTSTTEKQLAEKAKGYDQHQRQGEPRTDTMEKQLRDESIKGNETPADKADHAAGVTDQHQQTTEGQLNDWKGADKGFSPKDRITEKQLREDQADPLGRRLASVATKEDARFAIAAASQALARTAKATGATPAELIDAISSFEASPENMIRAQKVASTFDSVEARAERETQLKRASFYGAKPNTNMSSVCTFLLGSLSDVELAPAVGLRTLANLATAKNATQRIVEAIKTLKVEDAPKSAGPDLIKEALLDSSEQVVIVLAKKEIKADPKDKEAFANAAFERATKEANARNIKITERIKVAEVADEVEVTLMGVEEKQEVKPQEVVAKLENRSEARKAIVQAQVGPGGGMPGAPAGAPAGGTPGDMGGMGGPAPATPPVANLGGDLTDPIPGDDLEDEGSGEASPPGTICPVCGSDDVDVRGGDLQCNSCGAEGEVEITIKMKSWPDVITDKGPNAESAGGDEEGMGDEAMEMVPPGLPEVGVAASYKISPEMIKKAGKPIGSFCPRCGSTQIERVARKGGCDSTCQSCNCAYNVDLAVDMETPTEIVARIQYADKAIVKTAAPVESKKVKLDNALKAKGLTAAFAKASLEGKADIIAMLHDEEVL